MINIFKKYISPFRKFVYRTTGKKPWSYGYNDTRWDLIAQSIRNSDLLTHFDNQQIPAGYGIGFDERAVEYPWLFSKLRSKPGIKILDAGSTFNFHEIISLPTLKQKELTIFTFYPEPNNYSSQRISYVYGDLREMPFKDNYYDEVICQSTIEHVDMDNSIYGYEIIKNEDAAQKSYEYLKVITELERVVKSGGQLLITFPYGKFENHGFFQQFDAEMVDRILEKLNTTGKTNVNYLLYTTGGWKFAKMEECNESVSYNPHTGLGKDADGAAHCRCVCCIEFFKS